MKKIILLVASCAAIFGSCSKDNGSNEPQTRTIEFNVSAAEIFTTRANIYSSDAVQSIEDVHICIFKSTDNGVSYKYVKTIDLSPEWTLGSNKVTHTIARADMLEDGMYRFLAMGMDSMSDYTVPALVAGTTDYTTVTATLNTAAPNEVFSGHTDETIDQSIETIDLIMSRRPAGVLGYFVNIPTAISSQTVKYLRLTLAGSNTVMDMTTSSPETAVTPTTATGPAYNIFDIDLTATQVDADNNGYYDGTPDVGGVQKLPNSTLIGAYMIPVAFTTETTLTLSLVGETDNVLRSWSVKNESGATTYDILYNHFYSIGKKLKAANTTGDTPDTGDDDTPIDLSKAQTLIVEIAAGWGPVHNMDLQDNPTTR